MTIKIRAAVKSDAVTILHFINELAVYEKEPDAVLNTVTDIENKLFGNDVRAHALICEEQGEAIGFAVYFFNYSTWLGKYGLYLEDLYVSQNKRGNGAGKAIMKHLARLAIEKDCGRFEWVVLDWNQPAIDFYQSIGAKQQNEWIINRLSGDELLAFASK
ncbi:GNAT family N-acetyltransferase [Pseudoalteromonas aurantia]|uniref:GNAT family N-acetyltransferase n=2 Tax=Pseudoalteromonas TaxID=53246 RepID=A0A5S3V411_9GAMM|nr:GNAT family N-acetyltransferase [Pseudoalteromonas aurantia]TMO65069.1 GNAT family N-acetyltransferase [Pseudoalteromonas aurantia]TMO66215.1 GNAT family N-acetyltransferase [Pseudoalteromonas aurantia]TMO73137.1 GNAT family N-acetyltransferase [Pseudoalteromonas aurantia]